MSVAVVESNSCVYTIATRLARISPPLQGDVLPLAREPSNATDKLAVAVMKNGDVVEHVPYNLAPALSQETSTKLWYIYRSCQEIE